MSSVKLDNLAAEITKAVVKYTEVVSAAIAKAVDDTAKECKAEIVANSPTRTGWYKKGWRIKNADAQGITRRIIYNEHYQFVHLLEKGHAKRGGGRVEGKLHVEPAEQKSKDKLVTEIKAIIKRGG
jgi:hypothetical protein